MYRNTAMITTMSEPTDGVNRGRKQPVSNAIHRELVRTALNSHRRRFGPGDWQSLFLIGWQTGGPNSPLLGKERTLSLPDYRGQQNTLTCIQHVVQEV